MIVPMKNLLRAIVSSITRQSRSRQDQSPQNVIEALESRIAPASLAVFNRGTLLITGNPDGLLSVEQTSEMMDGIAVIKTTVTDNGQPLAGLSSFTGVKNVVVKMDKTATDANQLSFKLL